MSFRKAIPVLSIAVTISALTVLIAAPPKAEQPARKAQPGNSTAKPAGERSEWRSNNQMLASCVAIANQEEIAIAKWAEEHTKNDGVKEFARMLVKDHQAFLEKLADYAPEATRDDYLGHQAAAGGSRPQRVGEVPDKALAKPNIVQRVAAKPPLDGNNAGEEQLDPVQLHREIARQCLADSEAMLNKKQGNEFDECFVGMQIAKHAEMKTKLKVFERHTSGELKQLFADSYEKTSEHFDKAEKLIKNLTRTNDESKSAKSSSK